MAWGAAHCHGEHIPIVKKTILRNIIYAISRTAKTVFKMHSLKILFNALNSAKVSVTYLVMEPEVKGASPTTPPLRSLMIVTGNT